jgi:hypothetical protein
MSIDNFNDFEDLELEREDIPCDLVNKNEELGPGTLPAPKVSPRELAGSIMRVYHHLGGDSWLLSQARSNPREFMQLLKTVLPKDPEGQKTIPDIFLAVLRADETGAPQRDATIDLMKSSATGVYEENEIGSPEHKAVTVRYQS